MDKKIDVIFIALDALRAQNLGCYGYERAVSPHIDELARRGVLFEDAYSCINFTDPSFTTIFTGRYPLSHGILNHGARVTSVEVKGFEERGVKLLPEILREEGYRTLAVDWLWRWHKRGYDYYSGAGPQSSLHGFVKQQVRKFPIIRKIITQSVLNRLGERIFRVSKSYEDATNVTDQAVRLIEENRGKRVFLFLHYWDPHSPYLPPGEYLDDHTKTQKKIRDLFRRFIDVKFKERFEVFEERVKQCKREIEASYDGEISFADREIGRLIAFLKDTGRLENTLIVVTSDHGESLVEHGIYLDHHGLYDETTHVPMIFVHPELPRDRRVKGFVQHFDIVPTILDLLGIETDVDFDGVSVVDFIEGKNLRSAAYMEEAQWSRKRALRTEEWKFIRVLSEEDAECRRCGFMHGAMEELYDLKADPKETRNVVREHPELVEKMRDEMEEWAKKFGYGGSSEGKRDRSYEEDMEKVEERLKGLGYIS